MRPSLPEHLRREAAEIAAKRVRQQARHSRLRKSCAVVCRGLGILVGLALLVGVVGGIQYWLLERSTMQEDWRILAFCAVTSVEVFLASCLLGAGDGIFGKLVSFVAGLAQAGLLTAIVIIGSHLLGVDFSVIEHHERPDGRGIPVLEGLVAQTPWWYLVGCTLVTGFAFVVARDEESIQWSMGFSLPFFGSLAYTLGKFALDTGNFGRWF